MTDDRGPWIDEAGILTPEMIRDLQPPLPGAANDKLAIESKAKPFAFLAQTYPRAVHHIVNNCRIRRFNRLTGRGHFETGQPFVIVTDDQRLSGGADRLKGLEIVGFEVIGRVADDMIAMARAMVR